MGRILPTVLETKYQHILSRERSLAKAVARTVIGQNPVGVWDVMIPILFFFNFMRFLRARETFTLNFLFTKKLALRAAFDMIEKGKTKQEVMARIRDETSDILVSDKQRIYSNKIRQKQMQEIEVLIDHYARLLKAEDKEYARMVKSAYPIREHYVRFLGQLSRAEKEVNRAAKSRVRATTAQGIVSRMEEAVERIRGSEVEKIFTTIN